VTYKPIPVTRPHLPPLEEFIPYLEKIWESRILTNGGPFHQQLEDALCEYLGVPYISLFNNGTIALVTAIQALGLKGEVITTPYSFVATANALDWNDITPVFVDIDPETLNLDPGQIEAAVTPHTTGIMPVHCYGNPCDVDAIDVIAKRHGLKVIYDAAHAFGVRCHCGSVLNHGDLSVLSFHATKVFNTFEGGAIVCQDLETKQHIDQLRNFGLVNDTTVNEPGLNGKMSEFNAAVGLLQLKHIDEAISQRRKLDALYRSALAGIEGIRCVGQTGQAKANYSYFPVMVGEGRALSRDGLYARLWDRGILARRYFYPVIPDFPAFAPSLENAKAPLRHARSAAASVLCLPIFPGLEESTQNQVISVLIDALHCPDGNNASIR
jgi:dTDP-4-amino-4,6-dideoxygalactose transaminase